MNDPSALLRRQAETLHRQGRGEAAIDAYRRLLAIRPELADCWYNLGYLLKARGEYEQALAAYGHALAHKVGGPEEVHLNRAVIYADHLRRDEAAEQELRAALTLAPGYAPAWLNLGNLHEERGQREQAIACYERLLAATRPGDPAWQSIRCEALARMAHLRPPADPEDPMLAQLRQAAASSTAIDDTARANLYFALGRALDRLALYEQAFDAFRKGNQLAQRRGRPHDRGNTERLIDALIAAFPHAADAPTAEADATSVSPLFICGMFRSGSTLLEQVLAAHPRVTAGGELDFLPRLVAGPLSPFPATMASLVPARIAELAQGYRDHLHRLFPEAEAGAYITDKRPDNFLLIGLIKRMFPDARIIHTRRNPLDNGLSIYTQHLDQRVLGYANDLGDIGHHYGQYRRLMAHWQSLHGDSMFDFDYDGFVREPRQALERLFGFLRLPWDERCLQFHRAGNTVKTASYWQVRRPLYRDASGRWRHYAAHLEPLRRSLRDAGVALDD